MKWFISVLQNYAVFSGRARRSEYWFFILFAAIFAIPIALIDAFLTGGVLYMVYALGLWIPSLAVAVRRLHDTDRSGWWLLIALVPLVGLVLLVFLCLDSTPGDNRFGANPKGA